MPNFSRKKPLYRKVNTRARGVHHRFGGEYKSVRHARDTESAQRSMHKGIQRGLDYTPLYRFLISKVGSPWDEVHSEAVARLDKPEPIFWLVSLSEEDRRDVVLLGENSYFSGLYVDDDRVLRLVNPELKAEKMSTSCSCCTHTFNGVPFS